MKTQILALAGRAWTTAPMSDTISSGDRPSQKTYSDTSNCGDDDLEVWSWKTVRPWAIAYSKKLNINLHVAAELFYLAPRPSIRGKKTTWQTKNKCHDIPNSSQLFDTSLRFRPWRRQTHLPDLHHGGVRPKGLTEWSWMLKVATFVWIWGQQLRIVDSVVSSSFFQYNVHILQCTTLGLHSWKAEGQSLEMDGC